MALSGRSVALAEGRQLEDLANLLDKEGATIVRCPLLSILDHPEPQPLLDWIDALCAGRFGLLILLTGEGLRRLVALAERHQRRTEFVHALGQMRILTRGPKPGLALKNLGLVPARVAAAPTTEGVITTLHQEVLDGVNVAVQLYNSDNPPLIEYLKSRQASVWAVQPYVYAPASDSTRVLDLIQTMADGSIDVIVFTSAPQVDRLFEVAQQSDREHDLRSGLARTKVASVGPVVSDNLAHRGVKVDIVPAQGFQMKNLVQHIKRSFS